jgi:MoxR-like ATPase
MELTRVQELSSEVLDEVEKAVVGKRESLELVWLGFLADGHVLLEDFPGLAKTLAARSFAHAVSMRFARIQFTPDLMPSDVTGSSIWNQRDGDFEFRPGPIFTNLLLSDEINRAPPKTQAALLEAMQERGVTVDGVTHPLSSAFTVFATQNPIEFEGTYPLPEAELDRFLLKGLMRYPSAESEQGILTRVLGGFEAAEPGTFGVRQVADAAGLDAVRALVRRVRVEPSLVVYMTALVRATRDAPALTMGASPRASVALLRLAQASALVDGRDYVIPEDAKSLAAAVLRHRVVVAPELELEGVTPDTAIQSALERVDAPSA